MSWWPASRPSCWPPSRTEPTVSDDGVALPGREALAGLLRDQTVGQALRLMARTLRQGGIESPRLDAEVLLSQLLGCGRSGLYLRDDEPLSSEKADRLAEWTTRRLAHEPVAYLIGERAFYDLTFAVGPGALIPRPESEHLIEEALAWAREKSYETLRIADVGTGSGALAVTLARHLPQARVWAVDVSPQALQVAARNVERHGLWERVRLLQSNLLQGLQGQTFDLIVANLPYIPSHEMPGLMPDVRDYEPHLALDGGPDGADLIRRLLSEALERLAAPGLLLLEIDPSQAEMLASLAQATWPDASVSVGRDLAGLSRWIKVRRDEESPMTAVSDKRAADAAMVTRFLTLEEDDLPASPAMDSAVEVLRAGEPLVFPTDTVYGIGCDLWSERAIAGLYAAKQRPTSMPIPVLVSDVEQVAQVTRELPEAFHELARRHWPGGVTLIVWRDARVPDILCAGGDTVAVRMPNDPIALALIARMGGVLAVTSANLSGQPAPTTAEAAQAQLDGRVPLILDAGVSPGGQASTIVNLTTRPPRLLRQGGVTLETLRDVLPDLVA